ncbi:MAG: hypothetical protein NC206_10305 [Bacteroides sp.]|nr:hypothetical protein [Roseburia sp.]MCM1347459.1 hypothetical protein [Bacteroides sp.]
MKTNTFYCAILTALICIGCNHTNKETVISETKKETKTRILPAAPPKQEEKKDSVKTIEYGYDNSMFGYFRFPVSNVQDSIPSEEIDGTQFLCGFEVDEDSLMYFVGENPLQVACFNQTRTMLYRRVIEGHETEYDMMCMRNDSIYIVDEIHHTLLRMHKDGTGSVEEMLLADDSIRQCKFLDNCFMAYREEGEISFDELSENKWNQKTYDYAANLLDERTITLTHLDTLLTDSPIKSLDINEEGALWYYRSYIGEYKGLYLYYRLKWLENGEGRMELRLHDKEGNMIYTRWVDNSRLPMFILRSKNRKWRYLHFPEYEMVRNGKMYSLGYAWKTNTFIVATIDLAVAFPDL